ncbi:MAG TPA: di-heme oxidoredictase family protein, partial [Trichocoleus sp.]
KAFPAGTVLNTGLDVPKGALLPLGMVTAKKGAKLRVGLTCAACHASVDPDTGLVLEGAPNIDVDTGLLQAFATNSAAMFRQTGVNPASIPPGDRTYINAAGQKAVLPDAKALEDAVDAQLLAWAPGNFDSSPDNVNNPAQIPSSYTHETFPYGWSGFSSVGWFHGLTTLNNNVHAVNSDPTTGSYFSKYLMGIDQETMLGSMLQNAADPTFRLPEGVQPSIFLNAHDPTPGAPGLNEVIKMPGYPRGSLFIVDGLMASSPGLPVGAQVNGMSAYQNTLAPPPYRFAADQDTLKRGAAVFQSANCAQCHSGRYFTNHDVIPIEEIKTQSSRASALAKLPQTMISPETYPPSTPVPLPSNPVVLPVPTDITPERAIDLAYAIGNNGGIKVQNLIGLYVTPPYLHDGGAAATATALQQEDDGSYSVANPDEMGMAGTLTQNRQADPAASLRVLLDRNLRQVAVEKNRANPDLQITHVDGSGHEYWVDPQAGYSPEDQDALIEFLLAIDDDPEVLPDSATPQIASQSLAQQE